MFLLTFTLFPLVEWTLRVDGVLSKHMYKAKNIKFRNSKKRIVLDWLIVTKKFELTKKWTKPFQENMEKNLLTNLILSN